MVDILKQIRFKTSNDRRNKHLLIQLHTKKLLSYRLIKHSAAYTTRTSTGTTPFSSVIEQIPFEIEIFTLKLTKFHFELRFSRWNRKIIFAFETVSMIFGKLHLKLRLNL